MDVILLESLRNVGHLGEKVSVRGGYGRNYLIPQGKALRATEKNLAEFEARRAAFEEKANEVLSAAKERADALAKLTVILATQVGDEGKLFGSVGTRDIAKAITAAGVPVEKSEVHLPSGTLRYSGEYEIAIQLHTDVMQVVKVSIVPE